MKNKLLTLSALLSLAITSLYAVDIAHTMIPTKHNKHLTITDIAKIQPGLGSIMIEFSHRFYIAYYAAKAENWELAEYEIHELIEALEVAEVSRPKYASQLKKFESNSLASLQKAIATKDWKHFKKNYIQTTNACNRCHRENERPFIHYSLPSEAPKYLKMAL